MSETTEAELRTRFDVAEVPFAHGGWRVDVIVPRAADALIDEDDFAADERLPYWAELWPSARALTRHLLDHPPSLADAADGGRRMRALELGCGVALPSLALRSMGMRVLATDWYADALRFAEANAARNGLGPLRTAMLDWRRPPSGWWYDLVVAADVLYEMRNASLLADLLPRVTAPGGTVLVADPGRVYAADFIRMMRQQRWSADEIDVRTEPSAPGAESRVRIYRLRRGDGAA